MPAFYVFMLIMPLSMMALGESPPHVLPFHTAPENAVVLELFTSQGCSSCPPADRLLSKIGNDENLAGKVIPLAFHVDYWNHIGWTDPFSQKRWSQRQQDYAATFKSVRIYTPQLIINGQSELVGSDEKRAFTEIQRALAQPNSVNLHAELAADRGDVIDIQISAELLGVVKSEMLHVMVAVFERGLITSVKSGENARRTLHNDFVVRTLERAFEFSPQTTKVHSATVRVSLPAGAKRSDLGVAVFAQSRADLAIYGATALAFSER